VGKIETEYRTFQMEVLAGEANFETQVVRISAMEFTFTSLKVVVYFSLTLVKCTGTLGSKLSTKD
jgi:hypothetical protein